MNEVETQRPLSALAAYRAILGEGTEWTGDLKNKLLEEHAYGHYWLDGADRGDRPYRMSELRQRPFWRMNDLTSAEQKYEVLKTWLEDLGVSEGRCSFLTSSYSGFCVEHDCHVCNPMVRKVEELYREEKQQRWWAKWRKEKKAEEEAVQAQAAAANEEYAKWEAAEARRLDALEAAEREWEAPADFKMVSKN
jgi:hypothetical protein